MKTPTVYLPGPAKFPRILVYHEVSRRFHLGVNNVSPTAFQSHLDFLQASDILFVPLRGHSERLPERGVCLSFDDGYRSFYEEVFPTLVEREIPATIFIITEFAGKPNRWDVTFGLNRREHLGWERIREIASAGIEIGSHSGTHRELTRLSDEMLRKELTGSKKVIEDQTGAEVRSLALPFGKGSTEVFMAAREAGYREICGGVPGPYGPVPGILPRLPVYRGDSVKAIRRKLDWNPGEVARLKVLQSFSKGTRILKR